VVSVSAPNFLSGRNLTDTINQVTDTINQVTVMNLAVV
jgi:hypothetical protein